MSRRTVLKATAGAALLSFTLRVHAQNASTEVKTVAGRVRGESLNGVIRFLGIPYAASIAGANRFAGPQPVKPWTDVRDAKHYADSSPQQSEGVLGTTPVSPAFAVPDYVSPGDDCLAVNIWTPEGAMRDLPVMVWLHGGGWVSGSGSCAIYDGENLARRGDVVIVTLNHRLGASGLTDLSRVIGGDFSDSANLGIRDIIAALEWVRDNIAAFGGNPNNVTIFGESGGGWKVCTLLGIPSAEGLFHRAIIQSGPLTRFMMPEKADQITKALLQELGIDKSNADKLNQLSSEDIIRAEAKVLATNPMSASLPGFPVGFWPVIDGKLIKDHVFDPSAAPSSRNVPLLIGQTGTEFSLFMLHDEEAYSLTDKQLEERVSKAFGEQSSAQLLKYYREAYPDYDPSALWFRLFSDYGMGTLSSIIMDVRTTDGQAPVYAYRFDWETPIENGRLHSPHTIEIPFVFNNVKTKAGIVMTADAKDKVELAKQVSSAWVEFAKTGRPAAEGLPKWPEFTLAYRESMHLNTVSKVGPYMDKDMFEIFHTRLWAQAGIE